MFLWVWLEIDKPDILGRLRKKIIEEITDASHKITNEKMKIVIIAQNEPFFTQIPLQKLLEVRGSEVKTIIFLPHCLHFGSNFLMLSHYLNVYGSKVTFKLIWKMTIKFVRRFMKAISLKKERNLAYFIKEFSITIYNIKRLHYEYESY